MRTHEEMVQHTRAVNVLLLVYMTAGMCGGALVAWIFDPATVTIAAAVLTVGVMTWATLNEDNLAPRRATPEAREEER